VGASVSPNDPLPFGDGGRYTSVSHRETAPSWGHSSGSGMLYSRKFGRAKNDSDIFGLPLSHDVREIFEVKDSLPRRVRQLLWKAINHLDVIDKSVSNLRFLFESVKSDMSEYTNWRVLSKDFISYGFDVDSIVRSASRLSHLKSVSLLMSKLQNIGYLDAHIFVPRLERKRRRILEHTLGIKGSYISRGAYSPSLISKSDSGGVHVLTVLEAFDYARGVMGDNLSVDEFPYVAAGVFKTLNLKVDNISIGGSFSGVMENIYRSFVSGVVTATGKVALNIGCLFGGFFFLNKAIQDNSTAASIAAAVLLSFAVVGLHADIAALIRKLLAKVVSYVSSSAGEFASFVGESMATMIYAVVSGLVGCYAGVKNISKFFSFVGTLPKFHDGAIFLYERVIAFIDRVMEYLHLTSEPGQLMIKLNRMSANVSTWARKVASFLSVTRMYSNISFTHVLEYNALMAEGDALILSVSERGGVNIVRYFMKRLEDQRDMYENFTRFRDGIRQEPTCILLHGPPKVFKTIMMNYMARLLAVKMATGPEDAKRVVDNMETALYVRPVGDDFWSGYRGQRIALFDEMDADKEAANQAYKNIYSTIISMMNINPYSLNMAKLEDKDSTRFVSELVFMTSNIDYIPHDAPVRSFEAVTRRIDFSFRVVPAPEFADPENPTRLDFSKIDSVDPKFIRFQPRRWVGKHLKDFDSPLTMEQVVDQLYARVCTRREQHAKLIKTFRTGMVREMVATFGAASVPVVPDDLVFETKEELAGALFPLDPNGCVAQIERFFGIYPTPEELAAIAAYYHGKNLSSVIIEPREVKNLINAIHADKGELYKGIRRKYTQMIAGEECEIETVSWPQSGYEAAGWFSKKSKADVSTSEYREEVLFNLESQADLSLSDIEDDDEATVEQMLADLELEKETWIEWSKRQWHETHPAVKMVLGGTALIGSIFGAYALYKAISKKSPDVETDAEPIVYDSSSTDIKPVIRANNGTRSPAYAGKSTDLRPVLKGSLGTRSPAYVSKGAEEPEQRSRFYPQDNAVNSIASSVFQKSCYQLYTFDGAFVGNVLCVGHRVCVAPHHFKLLIQTKAEVNKWGDNFMLRLSRCFGDYVLEFPFTKFAAGYIDADQDLLYFDPGIAFRPHKNLLSKIVSDEDHSRYKKGCALAVIPHRDGNGSATWYDLDFYRTPHSVEVVTPDGVHTYKVVESYTVPRRFEQGDCGSLLYVKDPSSRSHKILGIFFASHSVRNHGLFTPLLASNVEKAMAVVQPVDRFEIDCNVPEGAYVTSGLSYTDFPISMKADRRGFSRSNTTSYVPTPLCEGWSPRTKIPANFMPIEVDGEIVDPKKLAVLRRHRIVKYTDSEQLSDVVTAYFRRSVNSQRVLPAISHVLTLEEAVYGIEGILPAMDWSTYNGFGYNLTTPVVRPLRKKEIFGERLGDKFSGPYLSVFMEQYTEVMDQLKGDSFSTPVVQLMFKDELLPISKVMAGRLRDFYPWPLHYYAIFRQYFGAFHCWFLANRLSNCSALGINPYSEEWDEVAIRYMDMEVLPFDVKKMDSSPHQGWYQPLVVHFVNRWYSLHGATEADNRIREKLCIVFSYVLMWVGDHHVEVNMGTFSGVFMTGLFNTMVIVCAFAMAAIDLRSIPPSILFDEVVILAHGDDVQLAFRQPLAAEEVSALVVQMESYGFDVVSAAKDGSDVVSMRLTDTTFLSRGFRFEPMLGRFVSPLKLETLLQIPYYNSSSKWMRDITCDSVDITLLELSLWGDELWDKYAPTIISLTERVLDYVPLYLTRGQAIRSLAAGDVYMACAEPGTQHEFGVANYLQHEVINCVPLTMNSTIETSRSLACKNRQNSSVEFVSQGVGVSAPPNEISESFLTEVTFLQQGYVAFGDSSNPSSTNDASPTDSAPATADLTDATTVENVVTSSRLVPSGLDQAFKLEPAMDLSDFFSRPLEIDRFSITLGAQPAGHRFGRYKMPKDFLETSGPMTGKAQGFLGFRGTCNMKVVVNANPFMQGWLLLAFVPSGGEPGNLEAYRTRSLTALTQLPHVKMDIACDTEMELSVPYVSPLPFYNMLRKEGGHGSFLIYSYTASATGASAPVTSYDVTVYCSYTDVEVATPTIAWVASGATERTKGPTSDEAGLSKLTLKKALDVFVPNVSAIASTAKWAMNVASNTMSAFGYSNPNNTDVPNKMTNLSDYGNLNSDMPSHSFPMGTMASNCVKLLDTSSLRASEEMTLEYISAIPSYFNAFEWLPSDPPNDTLATYNLLPAQFRVVQADFGVDTYDYVPWSYLADNLFQYWKGTVVLDFRFAKTQYHSGRICIDYYPGALVGDINAITDPWNYAIRTIADIRECNHLRVEFPFAPGRNYLDRTASAGVVRVRVLNPIRAPETCAQAVVAYVEASLKDCEFSYVTGNVFRPAMISTYEAPYSALDSFTYVAFGACDLASPEVNSPLSMQNDGLAPAEYCIGEKVTSILQVAKMMNKIGISGLENVVSIRPWNITLPRIADTTPPLSETKYNNVIMSYICMMYGFCRGSVDVGIQFTTFSDLPAQVSYRVKNTDVELKPYSLSALNYNFSPETVVYPRECGRATFRLPYYSHSFLTPTVPDNYLFSNEEGDYYCSLPDSSPQKKRSIFAINSTANFKLSFKVGDDFQFVYFLGVPRLIAI